MVRYSIVMPVYNEEKTIKKMIERVRDTFKDEDYNMVVVNDGSNDNTLSILEDLKREDMRIISYDENRGKGYAIRQGIAAAKGEYIGIQDADLEYMPKDLIKLFRISENSGFVVYGSRFLGNIKDMKPYIKIGNRFISGMFSLLYNARITDVETCYKVAPAKVFKSLNLKSNGFDIEIEITAKILKKNYFILEVPISYSARSKEEKKLKPFRDGLKALYKMIYYKFTD